MKKTTTAERLKEIMNEQNLKQVDIIERAKPFTKIFGGKLTRSDLSQYCSGKVIPSQEKVFLLAAALNVSDGWIMGFDVPRARAHSLSDDPLVKAFLQHDSPMAEEYIQKRIKESFNITNDEYDLIIAFRKADSGRQDSVRCLLGIDIKEKNENII